MVVRVNYDGPWPPEAPAEGFHGESFLVKGSVTKIVANVQLLSASRASGCLKHNAGAANVRTVAAVTVAVDAAAASSDEAASVKRLREACKARTDVDAATFYFPATRLAALKAENADSAAEAIAVGDVVSARVFAENAPFAGSVDVLSRAKRGAAKSCHASTSLYNNAAVDVDSSGFADKIMATKFTAPTPAAPDTNNDVEDDEWDD